MNLSLDKHVEYWPLLEIFLGHFQSQAFASDYWEIFSKDVQNSYMYVCIKVSSTTYVIVTSYSVPALKVLLTASFQSINELGLQNSLSNHPRVLNSRNTDNRGEDTAEKKKLLLKALEKYV